MCGVRYLMTSHPLEVGDGVTDGVDPDMAHVQTSRRVGKHGQDIKLLRLGGLNNRRNMYLSQTSTVVIQISKFKPLIYCRSEPYNAWGKSAIVLNSNSKARRKKN